MKYLEIVRENLASLIEERAAAFADMEDATAAAVDEKRSALTDEETAAHEAALAKVSEIDDKITEAEERVAELERVQERQRKVAEQPALQVIDRVDPSISHPEDIRRMLPGELRDKGLALFEARADEVTRSSESADKIDRLLRTRSTNTDGAQIAARALLTENDDYRSAFAKKLASPDAYLTPEEGRAVQAFQEFRAASSTTTAGGFGVPVFIDPTIVNTSQGSSNPFRRIARIETITNNVWKGVSSAGVTWSFDAEAAEVSDDAPTLAQPTVTAAMARGFIPFSIEIGMDYPNFQGEFGGLLAEGYDELQAQKFAVGSGTNEPKGVITALDAVTASEVTPTTDGSFGAVDINKVWKALPDKFKGNATWVMSSGVQNDIAVFANNSQLSYVTVDLTGVPTVIRSRPIEISSYFPDSLATTGAANILVVGDFRNFLIADRAGMDVELVPHLFHVSNNLPSGQRGLFAYARVGSDVINSWGLRLLQNQ